MQKARADAAPAAYALRICLQGRWSQPAGGGGGGRFSIAVAFSATSHLHAQKCAACIPAQKRSIGGATSRRRHTARSASARNGAVRETDNGRTAAKHFRIRSRFYPGVAVGVGR